jgi:thioredoxin-like negative regulator of GroEL
VVFVADDLAAWLVGLLADAARNKLIALALGSDQERALRKAATVAVQDTAAEMSPSVEQAGQFAMVISEVFRQPVPDAALTRPATLLEELEGGIARQLAVLDDAGLTGTGQSSADVLGVPGIVLAEKLTDHLIREIMFRGSGGGPLTPLADQLNHDLTHRMLARLAPKGQDARAQEGSAMVMRVGEADPRRLGVHAAISVPGMSDQVPPEYVSRDVDATEFGVRARVAVAAQRGGFVLLVGGSSVGKTRCAFEAVKDLLPDWWLVHPPGPGEVAALAAALTPRTVVWLDELQRYLDAEHGLTGAVVRALLNARHPAVIIGTLWPELYFAYTMLPAVGGADLHARERQVLDLADVVRVGPAFSPAEQDRARAAAARDPRLEVALDSVDYGLTQTLAAAPQLVARWQGAQTAAPYAWAVLTAALDVARLGARAPLSGGFLRAAAPGYCTSAQRAEAPENWFEQALAYATEKLHAAAAALAPAGAGMGQIAGYTPADYLIQHASRERRYERAPASTWDAILSHIHDPADTARLANSAEDRLLYRYAIPLYRHAVDTDASAGAGYAAGQLAGLLEKRGDLDEAEQMLRIGADADDPSAAWKLARLLAERGDMDGLQARADARDRAAAFELAELLTQRGDLDQAEQILRFPADAGHQPAAWKLARLLAGRGDLEGLQARADAGDPHAAWELARLLAGRGDLDKAIPLYSQAADAGDSNAYYAAEELADILAGEDLDGLRARADTGDPIAAGRLADVLIERGDLHELQARADAGDPVAVVRLTDLLTERGDRDGAEQILRAAANAGNGDAARRLADLFTERGDRDGAEQILDGAEQILRARADTSGWHAALELASLLAGRGDLDGAVQILDGAAQILDARTKAGDTNIHLNALYVSAWRANLLAEHGDLDGLRARADASDRQASGQLARLLAERGDLDGLRDRANAGDGDADRLADLLIKQGRGKEAEQLRRFGLNPDGSTALE